MFYEWGDPLNEIIKMGGDHPKIGKVLLVIHFSRLLDQRTELHLLSSWGDERAYLLRSRLFSPSLRLTREIPDLCPPHPTCSPTRTSTGNGHLCLSFCGFVVVYMLCAWRVLQWEGLPGLVSHRFSLGIKSLWKRPSHNLVSESRCFTSCEV